MYIYCFDIYYIILLILYLLCYITYIITYIILHYITYKNENQGWRQRGSGFSPPSRNFIPPSGKY